MPDRLKVMTQTKRDALALQVGDWAWSLQPHPVKRCFETSQNIDEAKA
jgi:hypothetical protein